MGRASFQSIRFCFEVLSSVVMGVVSSNNHKQTSAASVGMSQRCHKPNLRRPARCSAGRKVRPANICALGVSAHVCSSDGRLARSNGRDRATSETCILFSSVITNIGLPSAINLASSVAGCSCERKTPISAQHPSAMPSTSVFLRELSLSEATRQ